MRLNAIEAGPARSGLAPVVLLHGLFGQARNLGRLQRRLSSDRLVVAFDLRSHGASTAGLLEPRAMAADVAETMGALGMNRAVVAGHSLGGKVAMAVALDHPDTVLRLLVADIAPVAHAHGNVRLARALQALTLTAGLTRAAADAALTPAIDDPAVRSLLLQNLSTGERPHWRFGLDEIARSIDLAEGWPAWPKETRYDGPSLFVRGGRSNHLLEEHMAVIRPLFPAAEMVSIDGAGHWLHGEKPDEFLAVTRGFVAGADAVRR